VVSSIISIAECAKKKKGKAKKKQDNPLDRRPNRISPELYCDACLAIIKEGAKELRGKKKESDVYDILDDICKPERYYVYHHPPPDMRDGCEAFLSGWEEEIISVLTNRVNDDVPAQKLCYEISKV
jgi:hypothetical protein